tara:strand:+ start:16366 stop:16593 length:228 start_codon:yes stop_codon:yes gene_type:complete
MMMPSLIGATMEPQHASEATGAGTISTLPQQVGAGSQLTGAGSQQTGSGAGTQQTGSGAVQQVSVAISQQSAFLL